MAITLPDFAPSDGAVLTVFVPVLADPSAPTLSELTGSSAVVLSCYWKKDDDIAETVEVDTYDDNPACLREAIQRRGKVTRGLEALRYWYDPQNPGSVGNKAKETLPEDTKGYFAIRRGKFVEDFPVMATGDIIDVIAFTAGPQVPQRQEENGKATIEQELFDVRKVAQDYAVPAA